MTADLSKTEILILQTMWKLKALGSRGVTIDDLTSPPSDLSKMETIEKLKHLQMLGFATVSSWAGDGVCALSPLGAAFVRQLQDRELGDLAGGV